MVVRRRRKKNKLRGQRTHGGGGTKNRRGAGSRGGVGRAGSHKHKFSKYYTHFGTKRTLKAKEKPVAVNLEYIEQKLVEWVRMGKAKKDGTLVIVDGDSLGFGKVLARGAIKQKIRLVNASASKSAAEKIVAAGGQVEGAEETAANQDEGQDEEEAEA